MDSKKVNVKDILINNGIIILILLMVIFVGVTKENFFSIGNFSNISINVACRFIIAVGVSGCLITKGTDLSAGRAVGLAACVAGTLLQRADYSGRFELTKNFPELNVWLILLICVAVCCIFGLINGIVIAYLSVPAFIGTLGMQMIVYGINLVYTKSVPLGGYRSDYTNIANGSFLGIPYLFIIAIVIGLIMWFVYNYTRHGKYMYAIGGNEAAAEVAGVNVKKTKIIIYVTAAALYAIAGFLLGAKSGGAGVNTGSGYELEAIAACTIGGVSVNGGIGRVSGIVIGVLVFELLKTCLQFLGIDPNYQFIAQGIVIVVAIALDIRKYIAKK
ncbi:galactose/methyl galactoside ABC transporter permease MglC [Otoolea muris]|uniref:galactose/methyl galactoside ABC transporter permease MglC n=1 Tax=Otoolea muris TaxID=2941515 RepID=UPI00203E5D35|nr:beta-methylgalactoside transporter [Otoolea muris]